MSQSGCFPRFIGLMFLLGLLTLGGFLAYQVGISQGIAQTFGPGNAIQSADAVTSVPGFGFQPLGLFGGVCLSILGLFVFFGLVRFLSCAWRPGKEVGQMPNSKFNQTI